jgi:uncharacterized alkaline shock family protein YloU
VARVSFGDAAVARIAAAVAKEVPGVESLRPDLSQTLLGLVGAEPVRGATAAVQEGRVEITLTVVTTLGHNPRDLCAEIQRAVAARVQRETALVPTVTVTIAEILLP